MPRVILSVALPRTLESYVKERVAADGHGAPGDYICALIREDRERRTREKLDSLLIEGLDSTPDPVTPEYLAELRREAEERIERRRQGA